MRRNGCAGQPSAAGIALIAKCAMSGAPTPDISFRQALERIPQSELKRSRAAGTEELPRCFKRAIEARRVDRIAESRVVPVGRAPDVGDVEQIESFCNRLQRMRLLEMERPRDPHVKRV